MSCGKSSRGDPTRKFPSIESLTYGSLKTAVAASHPDGAFCDTSNLWNDFSRSRAMLSALSQRRGRNQVSHNQTPPLILD